MILFMSWIKNNRDLLDALSENRLVPLYVRFAFDGSQWADFDDDVECRIPDISQWLEDTQFGSYRIGLSGRVEAYVFDDPIEASLFRMNFGITAPVYVE